MTEDDKKYRQGRSKKQWESNETVAMYAFGCFVIVSLITIILNIFK